MTKQRTYETAEFRLELRAKGWEVEYATPFSGKFAPHFYGTSTGTQDLDRAIEIAEARVARRKTFIDGVDKEAAQRLVQEDEEAVDRYLVGCGRTRLEVSQRWQQHIEGFGLNPLDLVQEVRVKFAEPIQHRYYQQWKRGDHYPRYAVWLRRNDPNQDPHHIATNFSGPPGEVTWLDESIGALEWGQQKGITLTAALLGRAHGSVPEIFSTLMMASLRKRKNERVSLGPADDEVSRRDHTRRWFRERGVQRLCSWTHGDYHSNSTDVLPGTEPWYTKKTPETFPSGLSMIEHFAIQHARLVAQWRVVLLVDQDASALVPVATPEPEPEDYLQEIMREMAQRAEQKADEERRLREQRDKRAAKKAAKKPVLP